MLQTLRIDSCSDITVRDLLRFEGEGHPVYRTSHAGNWSSYKLTLSQLGLRDRVWEATCVHRDVNNQPQYQLIHGTRIQLVPRLLERPSGNIKQLTPYQQCVDKTNTLSSFHFAPLRQMYGDVVTTQSQELLVFKENIRRIFRVMQDRAPEFLGRYILPCGCMVPLVEVGKDLYQATCDHAEVTVPRNMLAESAFSTIEDLFTLVHEPAGYTPKGGVLYSLELVYACSFMVDFWKHGEKTIYMLSGPDMIKYATKKSFIDRIRRVMVILSQCLPDLAPRNVHACVVPTTLFRFGYPKDCKVSESIMAAHETIWLLQKQKRKYLGLFDIVDPINSLLSELVKVIDAGRTTWDLFHDSVNDAFFSQHDLISSGKEMTVHEQYLDTPFSVLGTMLSSLKHIEANILLATKR